MWPWLGVGAFVLLLVGCLLGGAAAAAVPSRIAGGVALCALPTLLALALLVVGVTVPELALVYASIVVSLLALPAFVVGVLMIVRGVRR